MADSRPFQRILPSRRDRVVPRPATDSLDEFATEPASASVGAVPQPPRVRQASWPRHPAVRIAGATAVLATVAASVSFLLDRGTTDTPPSFIAPPPSPVDVEYPEYPGAPLLETAAAAMPAPLKPESQAEQLSATAPAQTRSVVRVAAAPRPADTADGSRRAVLSRPAEPDTARAFDVRGAAPQAASIVQVAVPIAGEEAPRPADSPPRRIGAPIAVTTLGGTAKDGRVVLVLEVTEQGDVARIVSREGVDVHPDVIDSVATAARAWRYEPARRDGVAVPARVRVVVQLNGAGN